MDRFADIVFGEISAEKEAEVDASMLVEGFYDPQNILDKIYEENRFIILGLKGCGKTAIAKAVELKKQTDECWFVKTLKLGDFSFRKLNEAGKRDGDSLNYQTVAWQVLILSEVLSSLQEDNGSKYRDEGKFDRMVRFLMKYDLLKREDFKKRFLRLKNASVGVEDVVSAQLDFEVLEHSASTDILLEAMKAAFSEIVDSSTHTIIIDNLDDIDLKAAEKFDNSLWALVEAASKVNRLFSELEFRGKVLIFMRTDLYDILPSANKNKIRNANSHELIWFMEGRRHQESALISMVNQRAALSLGRDCDVVSEFMPKKVAGVKTAKYLLHQTRFRPRDIIMLMNAIKHVADKKKGKLTDKEIQLAVKDYARYFYDEVVDNLVGFMTIQETKTMFLLISSFQRAEIPFEEFKESAAREGVGDDDLKRWCEVFYDCGAIGLITSIGDGPDKYNLSYRNGVFQIVSPPARMSIILHPAICAKYGIPYSRYRED